MKRNKILYWSLLAAVPLLLSLAGCKKFLDRKPLTATLDDLRQGSLEAQALGFYTILRNDAGFSTLPWLDFHSIRDDDAIKGSDQNDGKEIIAEFETFQYNKDDWAINTYWNDHYAMINATNNAIAQSIDKPSTDASTIRNVGEACFFRAYAYFELVKNFGEVPLINFRIVNPTDGIVAKSTTDQLYAFIDSNLTVAVANLPEDASEYGVGYSGRVTKGTANALWAQSKLMRSDWAGVVALCNTIISSGKYSLNAKFSDNWKDAVGGVGKNGPESIFEMNATAGQSAANNNAVDNGSDFGTCQQVRQNGAPLDWNLGWGWNACSQELVDAFEPNDPRQIQTVLFSGMSDSGAANGGFGAKVYNYTNADGTGGLAQKYWNKKLYTGNDPGMRVFTGWVNSSGAARWINHRIIRYADVILMLAEAANETGDGATAEANLELIRNRASGGLGEARTIVPKIAFVSQAQMRTAIKNERHYELAMEGYRFYDLVRWGDALTVLGPLGYTNRARLYPIPQKAIDASKIGGNEILKQNPEW